jgi:hypothetical protein
MAKSKKRKSTPNPAPTPVTAPNRRLMLFGGAGVALVLVVITVVLAVVLTAGGGGGTDTTTKHAIIVDQLNLTQPDPDFVSQARATLAQAGYAVDYVSGDTVTVDFYRTLPSRVYDLVLLRAHAGITTEVDAKTGQKTSEQYVSLFTNEAYDTTKYSSDQMNRLGRGTYTDGGDPLFAIGPKFVTESMTGNFNHAIVVAMGCDGLRSDTTAQAFLDKGASAFVSWTKPVSGAHTDEATAKFLQHLLIDGKSVQDAVQQTANEVGPDPTYQGELRVLTS